MENQTVFSKLIEYIKGSRTELKKVQWPTRKETVNYTILVIAISLSVVVYLGVIDFFLNKILEKIVLGG